MSPAHLSNQWSRLGRALCLGIFVLALTAATADAGFLYSDDDAYIKGAVRNFGTLIKADMEYAVYYESAPDLGLSFTDSYIYAYQFFNLDPQSLGPINYFSMGILAPDPGIDDEWYVHDPLDTGYTSIVPSNVPGQVSPISIRWEFNSPNVVKGRQSEILYYTSAYGPDYTVGSLGGGGIANGLFPCPKVPEPGAMVLMLVGAISLFLVNSVRRILKKR